MEREYKKKDRNEVSFSDFIFFFNFLNVNLQLQGNEYVSRSGKNTVPAKIFNHVTSCCSKKCYEKINYTQQQKFHTEFWKMCGDYKSQNITLKGLMTIRPPNQSLQSTAREIVLWDYFFQSQIERISVCQHFLCKLLNIGRKRIRTVQSKAEKNEYIGDNRGKHENRVIRLTDEVKELIIAHCSSIPQSESHYTREKSSLQYFENPDLTLKKMYELFLEFYAAKTGRFEIPLTRTTYEKYFNYHLNFSFSKPRTDVCDLCFENKCNNKHSDLKVHKQSVKNYSALKKRLCAEKNVLCLEFDFAQNLCLPKIPVSDQFYKRLLWLHVFNVNVLGKSKRSYMFFFLEGELKKGANTVCNMLYDAIKREYNITCYDKIYLFSDSCGGQNKNYLLLSFLSLLSTKLETEIQHIYPVRGHSYCSCDRNFGMYGKIKKKIETIETVDEYYKIIANARNPPFTIIRKSDYAVHEFEAIISGKITLPQNIRIRDVKRIVYYANSHIDVFYDYESKPVHFIISESQIEFNDLLKTEFAKSTGISAAKINDVKSLLRYLSPKGKEFFNGIFENFSSDSNLTGTSKQKYSKVIDSTQQVSKRLTEKQKSKKMR